MKLAIAVAVTALVALTSVTAQQQCGRRNAYSNLVSSLLGDNNADNYIVGGTEARRNEFPWQISFQIYYSPSWWEPKTWTHNCGGSIINDQWIVTAAHCHVFSGYENYRIVAGAHNVKNKESTTQTLSVAKVIMHPGWNANTLQDDIALIKLDRKLTLDGTTAAAVCLPTAADASRFDGATCTSTGWGRTSQGGPASDVLLKVDLPIVSNSICAIRYRNVRGAQIRDSMICAGRTDRSGYGVCNGDSGGPLVCLDNGVYKLAGLTSFGVICGSSDHPAVYTRLSAYKSWIDTTMSRN